MTPKEKARELVDKFENDSWHDVTGFKGGSNIRCALIAVDEILNVLWHNHEINSEKMYRFYQEVKQEIENL